MSKKEGLNSSSTTPIPDQWYTLTLGSSFNHHHLQPSPKVCTLRYDFVPASVDKSQPGVLHRRKDKINVELNHVQPAKPKFNFEGTGEDLKENDAVMYFDGSSFRLERLHRAIKRLKHCRVPGEHVSAASMDASSPPVGRGTGRGQTPVRNNYVPGFTPPRSYQTLPPPPRHQPVSVEVERIDVGEVERIDIGEVERIDIGQEQIDIGEEQIDIGEVEVERIDIGEVERIDIGDAGMSGGKYDNDQSTNSRPPSEHNVIISPDSKDFDLEAHLDIMNDDDDEEVGFPPNKTITEENPFTGIDINLPHQNDSDDEIADVDVNDDNGVIGGNAAAALRAQVHQEEKNDQTSSSSASSGSGSSSSSSSDSGSSSSGSDSSDADSVNSI